NGRCVDSSILQRCVNSFRRGNCSKNLKEISLSKQQIDDTPDVYAHSFLTTTIIVSSVPRWASDISIRIGIKVH
ncbi:hypothetical protein WG66_014325, partial [Moniliophthora roreri]